MKSLLLFAVILSLNLLAGGIDDSIINPHDSAQHTRITLIDWRWSVLGKHIVYALFLLAAATVKILYSNTRYLREQIPESW